MAQTSCASLKLGIVPTPPFSTLHEAINKYLFSNPARAKALDIFEPEKRGKPFYYEFERNHPERIWSRIRLSIERVFKSYPMIQRKAWTLCNIGDRSELYFRKGNQFEEARFKELRERRGERSILHPKDAAKRLGVSSRTIFRWLSRIDDDLEAEFQRRGLITRPERVQNGDEVAEIQAQQRRNEGPKGSLDN